MGACYSVLCKLKFKDEGMVKEAEKLMLDNYREDLKEGVGFCLSKYDFAKPETVEQFLELYLASHQRNYTSDRQVQKNGKIVYEADSGFDASYGWHRVILTFFESIAGCLENGSYLKIDDDDVVTYRIKDGKVI